MKHTTTIVNVDEGHHEVDCSECGHLPGVYFTTKRARTAAIAHESHYNERKTNVALAREQVELIAKGSESWDEFHSRVMNNPELIAQAGGRKSLNQILQHSEAGMLLE